MLSFNTTIKMKFIIISAIINVTILFSGYFGWDFQIVLMSILSFGLGVGLSNKRYILSLVILSPSILIFGLMSIFESLQHIYPFPFVIIISLLFGVMMGKNTKNKPKGWSIRIISGACIVLFSFLFFVNYFHIISLPKPNQTSVNISNLNQLKSSLNNKRIIDTARWNIVYFWSSNCGFSSDDINLFYSDFNNLDTSKFNVCSINLFDSTEAIVYIDPIFRKESTINFYAFDQSQSNILKESLKISAYPTFLIIKKKQLLYHGSYSYNPLIFYKSPYWITK